MLKTLVITAEDDHSGTNWYDQAHSETVLESMDFDYPGSDTEWYCVMGGAQQLPINMQAKLAAQPSYNCKATAIRATGTQMSMAVDYTDSTNPASPVQKTANYNGVFASTTLSCLRLIDTTTTAMSYDVKQAIRSLGYGPSAKAGIKFSRAWWIWDLETVGSNNITSGGLGHSDLSIRTCVYPSYNIADPQGSEAVLLVSYTWQQDAERIGALMSSLPDNGAPDTPAAIAAHEARLADELRTGLRDLLIKDLATLHTPPGGDYQQVYKLINGLYVDHYSHDWTHDPNTMGAFAFFRPQQFSTLWPKLIQPSGDLVIVGEAASPHHAWVVGALESAVHGVHAWLYQNAAVIPGASSAIQLLETAQDGNPFVGLPPYMDSNTSRWTGALANVQRELHAAKLSRAGKEGKVH